MTTEKKEVNVLDTILQDTNIQLDLLKDMLQDYKKERKRKHFLIVLLVILLFAGFVYYNFSLYSFLSGYDYNNTIVTNTNDNTAYDENSPINANIKDINVNSNK